MKPGEMALRAGLSVGEIARSVEPPEVRTLNYFKALAAIVGQHPDGLRLDARAFHSIGPDDELQANQDPATGDLILRLVRR